MARTIVRTVYGADLQTARQLGRPHAIDPYTTINEVMADTVSIPQIPSVATQGMEITAAYDPVADTSLNKLSLFCIGNGGHENVSGPTGGIPFTRTKPHKATDAGLYHQIPFVIRPIASDLDSTQRQKYRLRRTLTIGGSLYAAYYGKVLDYTGVDTEKVMLTTVSGVTTRTPFVPTINNLRPTAPATSSPTTGTFLEVSAGTEIPFTEEEAQWLRDAAALLFGDENYAIVSEISLCSGVDKVVTQRYPNSGTQTPVASTGGPYYETVACQVNVHISTFHSLVYTNDGIDMSFDVGATEPLFGNNLA